LGESSFQARLIKDLEKEGWYVIKLIQTNKNGIPDLLCLHKLYPPKFIEVKAKDGKVSELQKYRHKEIKRLTGIKTQIIYEDS
jgi:Holliday junction resolvase